ncbi:hypothetical protein ACFO3D_02810 [Virgibacillus kekensis]|uniref:RNA polymerase subunit sigma n=1 Tax=Virgibacillus kekensis TaxID=202261 RepID=A0ABV9DFG7_9BACI
MGLLSWKSIEMQVALPRTQDAGKLQEQMLKQNQHFQESLAGSQLKEAERKRIRVQEMDNVEGTKVKEKQEIDGQEKEQEKQSRQKSRGELSAHPYLGTQIDFNG